MTSFLASLGPRTRTVLRYAGFVVLALVTFVFAFQLTFPFDRVKDKAIEALSEKYDVTIGNVERGIIPGRMYFKAVSIRTRPTKAGDVATTFYMDQLGLDLGLFAALHGTVSVKLDAKIGTGHIQGTLATGKDGTSVDLTGSDLPSASLPVREALGLPMSGKVRFAFDLDLPNEKAKGTGKLVQNWAKASGSMDFACPSGCTVGDGKSKLKLTTNNARQQEFLDQGGGGIDFGKVNVDSLFASVEIKNGKLEITRFETKSGDGELHIALGIALNQDVMSSQITGCLRFHGSDALLKREPKTHAAISTTGAPLGPDGLFHIKLDGPLRQVRRIGVVCGSTTGGAPDATGGTPSRPNLPTPEISARPPGVVTLPAPPAAAPPPAAPPAAPPPAAPNVGSEVPTQPGSVGEGPAPAVVPTQAAPPLPPSAQPPPPVAPNPGAPGAGTPQ